MRGGALKMGIILADFDTHEPARILRFNDLRNDEEPAQVSKGEANRLIARKDIERVRAKRAAGGSKDQGGPLASRTEKALPGAARRCSESENPGRAGARYVSVEHHRGSLFASDAEREDARRFLR
jgi:hypothetical protein